MPTFIDNVLPATPGLNLGSSLLPYNIFAQSLINSGNETISGTLNVLGSMTAKVFENIQIVDQTLSRGGVDIGDEINKAYAALPSGNNPAIGGSIWIIPRTDGTCHKFSTPNANK